MNLDDNKTKIALAAIALLAAIAGGALIAIKAKKRKTTSTQSGINQTGDGNKVTGGDDNSTTTITK